MTELIRDFPDHATFREKSAKLACADKLGVLISALCNRLIRPKPCRHASLVCLSNYLHGDHRHEAGSGKDSIDRFVVALARFERWCWLYLNLRRI